MAGIMSYQSKTSCDFYVLWIGPRVGSGRVTPFPCRVGSQNLDPRATLGMPFKQSGLGSHSIWK